VCRSGLVVDPWGFLGGSSVLRCLVLSFWGVVGWVLVVFLPLLRVRICLVGLLAVIACGDLFGGSSCC
jgi:hypothetical protein